jgi:hypothetical protein
VIKTFDIADYDYSNHHNHDDKNHDNNNYLNVTEALRKFKKITNYNNENKLIHIRYFVQHHHMVDVGLIYIWSSYVHMKLH